MTIRRALTGILLLLLVLTGGQGWAQQCEGDTGPVELARLMVMSSTVPAGAPAVSCTGDFAAGGDEHFEAGEGSFCTSNMTESDANGILSTYDSAQKVTGTYSMSSTLSGTEYAGYAYGAAAGDATSGDTVRFYFYVTTGPPANGNLAYIFQAGSGTTGGGPTAARIRLYNSSGNLRIDARGAANGDGPTISANTWYRVEMRIKRNAEGAMQVFSLGGAQVGCDVAFTASDVAADYWLFGMIDVNYATPSGLWYHDNIKLVRGSMATVGADE